MSGGHFDYNQYRIDQIAEDIDTIIRKSVNKEKDQWGYGYEFSEETLSEFRTAYNKLKEVYVYVQRIDWLVSGDDGEKTFHERLKEDLENVETY